MKFFILCSLMWTVFSVTAVTLHHSDIPQEDQQYLNLDMNTINNTIFYTAGVIHFPELTNRYKTHFGCNSRDEYIGRCLEYCRPPNPQDQNVSVICSFFHTIRIEHRKYMLDLNVPHNYTGIGTSSKEAQEDVMSAIESAFPSADEAVKRVRAEYDEPIRIVFVNLRSSKPFCTPVRVCVGVEYSP